MSKFYVEWPTQTRVREDCSGNNCEEREERIVNVSVTIERGDFDLSALDLSRLAAKLLTAHLNDGG